MFDSQIYRRHDVEGGELMTNKQGVGLEPERIKIEQCIFESQMFFVPGHRVERYSRSA